MNSTKAKDLTKLFTSKGFNPVIGTIYTQQQYWKAWYRGLVDGFHNTQMKNAEGTLISVVKPSLQMAKKVSEDITSLLFNENTTLTISNKAAQTALDNVLEANYYYDEMPTFVEYTIGPYGTGLQVEYVANNETKIKYLYGDKVLIISYENTTPTEVAVIQEFVKDKMKYNHVTCNVSHIQRGQISYNT